VKLTFYKVVWVNSASVKQLEVNTLLPKLVPYFLFSLSICGLNVHLLVFCMIFSPDIYCWCMRPFAHERSFARCAWILPFFRVLYAVICLHDFVIVLRGLFPLAHFVFVW
jgi:hypothetical protein